MTQRYFGVNTGREVLEPRIEGNTLIGVLEEDGSFRRRWELPSGLPANDHEGVEPFSLEVPLQTRNGDEVVIDKWGKNKIKGRLRTSSTSNWQTVLWHINGRYINRSVKSVMDLVPQPPSKPIIGGIDYSARYEIAEGFEVTLFKELEVNTEFGVIGTINRGGGVPAEPTRWNLAGECFRGLRKNQLVSVLDRPARIQEQFILVPGIGPARIYPHGYMVENEKKKDPEAEVHRVILSKKTLWERNDD